jgi:hypothetical protein
MGINHGGRDMAVTEQLLHGANVVIPSANKKAQWAKFRDPAKCDNTQYESNYY